MPIRARKRSPRTDHIAGFVTRSILAAPLIVPATFSFGEIIILEAALSFLGFGVQPPSASWGNMLNNVRDFMLVQPWRAFVPGVAIFLASSSFNFVGDALRDALDPRLKL